MFFTVSALGVLCLTDCGLLLPGGGLDNCHRWVFSTNKVLAMWAVWLSGTPDLKETFDSCLLIGTQSQGIDPRHEELHFGYIHSDKKTYKSVLCHRLI